jgi:hypothetical protein
VTTIDEMIKAEWKLLKRMVLSTKLARTAKRPKHRRKLTRTSTPAR